MNEMGNRTEEKIEAVATANGCDEFKEELKNDEQPTKEVEPLIEEEITEEKPTAAEEEVAEEQEKDVKIEDKEAEIERMLAEAEARGYDRGRNERIETWLNEGRSKMATAASKEPESEIMILNNMRKSVWE